MDIAHHTSIQRGTYQNNWGTPKELIDLVREHFGGIDYDLASSTGHNKIVKARNYHCEKYPCPQYPYMRVGGVSWLNPPGPGKSVIEFWNIWRRAITLNHGEGAFLIFNLDHWRQLPGPGFPVTVIILRKRLKFIGAKSSASFPSALVLTGASKKLKALGHCVSWG